MNGALLVEEEFQEIPEQRLWQAVLVTALREWLSGPLRRRIEAERYLFYDQKDFRIVCESAGMNPERLRERLSRFRKTDAAPPGAGSKN